MKSLFSFRGTLSMPEFFPRVCATAVAGVLGLLLIRGLVLINNPWTDAFVLVMAPASMGAYFWMQAAAFTRKKREYSEDSPEMAAVFVMGCTLLAANAEYLFQLETAKIVGGAALLGWIVSSLYALGEW